MKKFLSKILAIDTILILLSSIIVFSGYSLAAEYSFSFSASTQQAKVGEQ